MEANVPYLMDSFFFDTISMLLAKYLYISYFESALTISATLLSSWNYAFMLKPASYQDNTPHTKVKVILLTCVVIGGWLLQHNVVWAVEYLEETEAE